MTGARPGGNLQVNFRGTERLEASVTQAARRLAIALAASGAIVGTALTVTSPRVHRWVPGTMGAFGGLLSLGLLADLGRRKR